MTGCADRIHNCIKQQVANILGFKKCNVHQSCSRKPDVRDSVSLSLLPSGLLCGGMRGLACGGGVGCLQLLGVLGWMSSGISKLAEELGPPRRSDVTNSSRECFAFLFLAVVRSFPERLGKKHSRIIFWSIWDQ